MQSFFETLDLHQQCAAISYRGPENHGTETMKRPAEEKFTPYEKWSRAGYRMAYEESEHLRKKDREELKLLREDVERLRNVESDAVAWARHAIILGRTVEKLLARTDD